jgi:hypothetical protein
MTSKQLRPARNAPLKFSKGHLEIDLDGAIRIKKLGEESYFHHYQPSSENFAGDCVHQVQRHFIESLRSGGEFESTVEDYLKSVLLVEKAYQSASQNQTLTL